MTTPAPGQPRPGGELLSIEGLRVDFTDDRGRTVHALDGAGYTVRKGEILGVVGESGSGKTVSALTLMGLLPHNARGVGGEIRFDGLDILGLARPRLRALRGSRIGMIFQDPMTALDPVMRVGDQIDEAYLIHHKSQSRRSARSRTLSILDLVGVADPESRARQYPHQWSGGMRQRAMIAMALINGPDLLIADEPTTALDATVQAQVIDVLGRARAETGVAVVLITHNLGIIAEVADRVAVMYAGRVVEHAAVRTLLRTSAHPYTQALIASRPGSVGAGERLTPIRGLPPRMLTIPPGCSFQPRCTSAGGDQRCVTDKPELAVIGELHDAACHHAGAQVSKSGEVE
jgi:oligopeptide/dipeptide ABC transporter ATP-binding protein